MSPAGASSIAGYVGDVVIHTPDGDIDGVDHGRWDAARGNFIDRILFTGGTGPWASVEGHVVFNGAVDFATFTFTSTYHGAW